MFIFCLLLPLVDYLTVETRVSTIKFRIQAIRRRLRAASSTIPDMIARSVAASTISATRRVEAPPSSLDSEAAGVVAALPAAPRRVSAALGEAVVGATGATTLPDASPQVAAILGDWGLGVEVGAGSGGAVPAGVSMEPFPPLVPPPLAGPPAPPAAPPAALPVAAGTPAGAHGAAARAFDCEVEESALPLGCA